MYVRTRETLGQAAVAAALDVPRAVRLNRQYAQRLGWQAHFDRIVRLLGFTTYTPGEQEFAEAVARWQRSRGLIVDGIIGSNTWSRMRTSLGIPETTQPTTPFPGVPTPAPGGTPSTLPAGPFGTLTLALPSRAPFTYRFTPQDVNWTARFIMGEAGGKDTPENRAVIWAMHRPSQARGFDRILVMHGGRLVERGSFDELAARGSALADLIAAE